MGNRGWETETHCIEEKSVTPMNCKIYLLNSLTFLNFPSA